MSLDKLLNTGPGVITPRQQTKGKKTIKKIAIKALDLYCIGSILYTTFLIGRSIYNLF